VWDGGDFRVYGGIFGEITEEKRFGVGYDHGLQPRSWLQRVWIQSMGIRINTKANILSKFS